VVGDAVIYSQAWKDFTLRDFESSLPGLTWTIQPADPAELEVLDALCGQHISVTLPENMPSGKFTHWLKFSVASSDPSVEPQTYQLDIVGEVLGRLAVYGNAVDNRGVVYFDTVPAAGAKKLLVVKVRDEDRRLNVTRIVTQPEFVQATLKPYDAGKQDAG